VSKMLISQSAFGSFYGSNLSVLVGTELHAGLAGIFPDALTVFLLSADGLICTPSEAGAELNQRREMAGMAIGLKAIFLAEDRVADADWLIEHSKKHDMPFTPRLHSVAGSSVDATTQASAFVSEVLAQQLATASTELGTTQQQMVNLRGRYERLWLSHEKAQRMIKGIGFNLRNVCFSLTPGKNTVAPTDGAEKYDYRQLIPTDLAGLAGLQLYVEEPPAATSQGNICVNVRREADNALIGSANVSYSDIEAGWLAFAFPVIVSDAYGDGALEIVWDGSAGPAFAFADIEADRYGDSSGRTLALRIEKGLSVTGPHLENLSDTSLPASPTDSNFLATGARNTWQVRTQRLPDLAGNIVFYQGAVKLAQITEKLGFSPMTISEETSSLQTHPFEKKVSAAVLRSGLPVGALRISCEAGTAHESAPEFLYILAILPHDIENSADAVDACVDQVRQGTLSGLDQHSGVQWCARTLQALKIGELAIELAEVPTKAADVVFGAIATSGDHSYGWCRWYSYSVTLADAETVKHSLSRPEPSPAPA